MPGNIHLEQRECKQRTCYFTLTDDTVEAELAEMFLCFHKTMVFKLKAGITEMVKRGLGPKIHERDT